MNVILAPMEGLADFFLRQLLTSCGGFDLVITEFIRVVDRLLPRKVFEKQAPELLHASQTNAGTPVRLQLLGSHPQALAENAQLACSLGSYGIDLNFGCPSKTVNASKGGAILLTSPEVLYQVVTAVRKAVPADQVVSAKMRLGYHDSGLMWECAHAIKAGGANELTVHARTKQQGYQPPAYWSLVADFEQRLKLPVTINGEIWDTSDALNAMKQSNTHAVMLGRGAVRNPFLASQIKGIGQTTECWSQVRALVICFWEMLIVQMPLRYCAGRLKQWLKHLSYRYEPAQQLYLSIVKLQDVDAISTQLYRKC